MDECKVQEMFQTLTRIDTKLDMALTQLEDHETRLRVLEGKSGKRWDTLVAQIISLLVAGGLGVLLGKLF